MVVTPGKVATWVVSAAGAQVSAVPAFFSQSSCGRPSPPRCHLQQWSRAGRPTPCRHSSRFSVRLEFSGGGVGQLGGEVTVLYRPECRPTRLRCCPPAVELRLFLSGDFTLVQLGRQQRSPLTVLGLEALTAASGSRPWSNPSGVYSLAPVGVGLHQFLRRGLRGRLAVVLWWY